MNRRWSRIASAVGVLAGLWGLLGAPTVAAQQALVQTSQAPYYAGVPIDVQVIVDGFDESPQPNISAPALGNGQLELIGMSPSVSTNMRIINGRVTQWKRVRFGYRYRLLVPDAGKVTLGPFTVVQGAKQTKSQSLALNVETIPSTAAHRIRLVIPNEPVWVGQRVRVRLEWWLAEASANRIASRRAQVPLFDRLDAFRFEDHPPPAEEKTVLIVDTRAGPLELRGNVRDETYQGARYLVVSFERTVIPLKPGTVTIAASTLTVQEAVRFSRNLFGDRVPSHVQRAQAKDQPRELVVQAAPDAGRPPSFSGAVGQGFSISVSADRTVVQAGDPIRLSVTISGDTALETIGLPPLATSGLGPMSFRVPSGDIAGVIEGGAKQFEVAVRVLSDEVQEIPPIEFSWFDPVRGRYDSAHSRPIALSVRGAKIVSATDVVRDPTLADPADPNSTAPAAQGSNGAATKHDPIANLHTQRPMFSLSGAELAIVTDPETLLRPASLALATVEAQASIYGFSIAVVVLAWLSRRRAHQDPAEVQAKQVARQVRNAIGSADDAAGLARAIRMFSSQTTSSQRGHPELAELNAILQACDNIAYAPSSERAPNDPELKRRAQALVDAVWEAR